MIDHPVLPLRIDLSPFPKRVVEREHGTEAAEQLRCVAEAQRQKAEAARSDYVPRTNMSSKEA